MADLFDPLELESDWKEFRDQSIQVISDGTNIADMLEMATLKTKHDVKVWLDKKTKKAKEDTSDNKSEAKVFLLSSQESVLEEITAQVIQTFLKNWLGDLRKKDFSYLLGFILEGQNLPVVELKAFMQALPQTLLKKMVGAYPDTANGVYGLAAIELNRRDGILESYELQRDSDGHLRVTFYDRRTRQDISFTLNESFAVNKKV